MSAAVLHREPGSVPAAVLSVLVHVGLIAFLFFGIRWQSKLPDAVQMALRDDLQRTLEDTHETH